MAAPIDDEPFAGEDFQAFYGILMRMFFNPHSPAHFMLDVASLKLRSGLTHFLPIHGQLPSRELTLVQEWATMHKAELLEDWRLCRENSHPAKFEPLS